MVDLALNPIDLRMFPILGYETSQRLDSGVLEPAPQDTSRIIPCDVGFKLLGYVPVLNIIVGVGRLIAAAVHHCTTENPDAKDKRMTTYLVGRGIVEILGFGVGTMFLDFGKATITYIIIKKGWHDRDF